MSVNRWARCFALAFLLNSFLSAQIDGPNRDSFQRYAGEFRFGRESGGHRTKAPQREARRSAHDWSRTRKICLRKWMKLSTSPAKTRISQALQHQALSGQPGRRGTIHARAHG